MATEIVKRFRIEGKAKTAAARAELKKMEKSIANMGKRSDGTTKEMEQLQRKMDALKDSTARSEKRMKLLGKAIGAAGIATAVVGAIKGIDALVERSQKLQDVMGNLPFGIDAAATATGGLVDKFTLAKSAIAANRLGVAKTEEEFARLTAIGSKLARSLGRDATSGVEDLTTALARQSPMILDNLGITLKAEEANKAYAEQIHKTVDQLTDAEKKQAFVTIALQKGEEAAAGVTLSVDNATKSWLRAKTELQDLASDTLPAVTAALGDMVGWVNDASDGWAILLNNVINGADEAQTKIRSIDQALAAQGDEAALQRIKDRVERLRQEVEERRAGNEEIRKQNALLGEQVKKAEERKSRREAAKARGRRGPSFDPAAANRDITTPQEIDLAQVREINKKRLDNIINFEEAKARVEFDRRMRAIEEQRAAGVDPVSLVDQELAAKQRLLDMEQRVIEQNENVTERRIQLVDLQNEREQAIFEARMQRMEIERQQISMTQKRWSQFAIGVAGAHAETLAAAVIASKGSAAAFFQETKALATQKALQATVVGVVEVAKGAAAAASFNAPAAAAHFSAATTAFAQAAIAGSVAAGAAIIGANIPGGAAGLTSGFGGPLGGASFGGGGGGGGLPSGGGGVGSGGAAGGGRPTIPGSTAPAPVPPPAQTAGGGTGSTTVININGGLFAQSREELGLELQRLTSEAKDRFGS